MRTQEPAITPRDERLAEHHDRLLATATTMACTSGTERGPLEIERRRLHLEAERLMRRLEIEASPRIAAIMAQRRGVVRELFFAATPTVMRPLARRTARRSARSARRSARSARRSAPRPTLVSVGDGDDPPRRACSRCGFTADATDAEIAIGVRPETAARVLGLGGVST